MELVIRNLREWESLFHLIDQIKNQYGSSIIQKTILEIETLQQQALIKIESKEFLDILYDHGFRDLEQTKKFLRSILSIYRFSDIIKEFSNLKENYGIEQIAFILEENHIKKIPTFFTSSGYQKVYFSKNMIPFYQYHWDTFGIDEYVFSNQDEFIVDKKDFIHNNTSRVLYTSDFRLRMDSLPHREEMDLFQIEQERYFLFSKVLESLEDYKSGAQIHFYLQDPNGIYLKANQSNFHRFWTVRSDGKMLNENEDILYPSDHDYYTSKIFIQDAKMVMMAKVIDCDIQDIYLIVDSQFINSYFDYLNLQNEKVLKNTLLQLLEIQKYDESVKRLLLKI